LSEVWLLNFPSNRYIIDLHETFVYLDLPSSSAIFIRSYQFSAIFIYLHLFSSIPSIPNYPHHFSFIFIYFLSAGNLRIAPIAPVLFFPNHFCPGALLWFETVSGIRSDCDLEMVCCILQNFAKVTEMKIIAAAQQPPINNWAQD